MEETERHEVLIVGAGTTGSYLAWKLASVGFDCLVLEAESLDSLGTRIGPFHMEEVAFERFGIPLPQGAEHLHTIADMKTWSPGLTRSLSLRLPTLVMDKPSFIRRLHYYATSAGAAIRESTRVVGPFMEDGVLRGAMVRGPGGEECLRASLVIDASGIGGAVRSLIPASPWFEGGRVSDRDTIFVYMETWRDIEGAVEPGVESFPYFQGWCAPGPGDTTIVGVGMTGGLAAARLRHRAFVGGLPFEGKVEGSTWGTIPYRRPPRSLVENGLMVLGDAAFMNKPFSGEGVTSAFAACVIAEEVVAEALARGDTTREALWPLNVEYMRGQGAKFAFLTAMLPIVMSMGPTEMDFIFGVPGLLTEEGSLALQLDYEVRADPAGALEGLPHFLRGIAGGDLRPSTLLKLFRGAVLASALKGLYGRFPAHPADFGRWSRSVEALWRGAEQARYRYFDGVARGLERGSR